MLTVLQTGHKSNCGWTKNFCSEDFIAFPMISSENLREDFLLRFRSLVLAVAEFARQSCGTVDSVQAVDAQPISSSSSKVINPVCIRLKVGEPMYNCVPRLSQWTFGYISSPIIDDNKNKVNTIEIPILPISSPACRSRLAAAVEAADSQLLRLKNSDKLSLPSGVHSIVVEVSGHLDTRAPETSAGDITLNPDIEIVTAERVSQQVIKLCALLAVSGWVPTSSKVNLQQKTAADTYVGATMPSRNVGSATELINVSTSNVEADGLRCGWCGRSFPMKYLTEARVDPLLQHRSFCQWSHYSGNEQLGDFTDDAPGWLKCAEAVVDNRESILDNISGQPDAHGCTVSNRRLSAIIVESNLHSDSCHNSTNHSEEPHIDSAEQAYKKIKLVLDSATLPRLGMGSRRSI